MDDLISRAELFDELNRRGVPYNAEVNMVINGMPSAQPEVIRCKDCLIHGVCRFEQGLGLDGYCSQAERRTDE